MGQQVLSAKQTMPKVSIGKGTREAINDHGYLSEEHARRVGAESYAFPGAKYEVRMRLLSSRNPSQGIRVARRLN